MDKYTIKRGDTFWGLERKYGLRSGILTEINPGINPRRLQIGQEINFPEGKLNSNGNKYIIKRGDTFWGLERKHGLQSGILTKINPGINPRRLQIGQEINFPDVKPSNPTKPIRPVKKAKASDIVKVAKLVIDTYIRNNVIYSQTARQFGLDARYSDCSATVNTIMVESGHVDKLSSTYTAAMRTEIRNKGGNFRKDNPLEGDIMMWGGHVTIVTSVRGNTVEFAHMGVSGPRIGRVTLKNNRLDSENVWGSGGFIGFWTVK